MNQTDITETLEAIAVQLDLQGEDDLKVRAYQKAARAIGQFSGDIGAALESGELAQLKGVGPATLEVVAEAYQTGSSSVLENLRDQIPPGVIEMLRISGLGVAKVRQIHRTLHITSLEELEAAAHDGQLARLPRFGPRTEAKVLKGIRYLRQVSEFWLLHHGIAAAQALTRVLEGMPGVRQATYAGSVRRRREIIRDLDFVVALTGPPAPLVKRLSAAAGVHELNSNDRVITLRFSSGTVADIYWAEPAQFGFQLLRATGSIAHLDALRARAAASGLSWTDDGIGTGAGRLTATGEDDVYRALGLPFIPPELREGKGEVEAALAGTLPDLVEPTDICGFLHCHSNYSDGGSTVREWAEACHGAGYTYLGITDHSQAAVYAGGLSVNEIRRQHEEIDAVNGTVTSFRILKGLEAEILPDGSLDYNPEVRAAFDFIIASVHSRHGMSESRMTRRILTAMEDPRMVILGHPTGRLLLSRDGYPLDLDAVLEKAARVGVAIEINADPQRLDLDWRLVRRAVDAGVTISIGADAHAVSAMGNMDLGIAAARKGWLTARDVLNARPLEGFLEFVQRRRSRR